MNQPTAPRITSAYQVVTIPDSDNEAGMEPGVYVIGGEYANDDGEEIVIRIDYAIDENGFDATEYVAEQVTAALSIGIAVVPNIKRNYDLAQLHSNHPDIWDMAMSYVADGFHACLATYRHGTIKRRAARYSVNYLHRQGYREVTLRDLPIRHT